ncbi:hypothetical protein ALC60_02530 [Trachymyrmex zeteki]|uniref:Uncharacterized protein n=1 Tax=Mycetomoellerius zeteki TaxID=64791 RepID=A0A151XDN9_9HYME|nr:hypothetical protein ALC60_02530 [Trachymyrmex zeteki]
MREDFFSERHNGSVENRFPGELPGYYIELAGRRDRGLVQMEVARSRNEICVTRGPTSPGLALLLLSSAQPGAVQFSSRRVARYIIQLCHSSYTHEPAKVRRGQRANRSNERGERSAFFNDKGSPGTGKGIWGDRHIRTVCGALGGSRWFSFLSYIIMQQSRKGEPDSAQPGPFSSCVTRCHHRNPDLHRTGPA